ncbi:21110_t:CDS:1 [Cetraspora pellucida]|uniref:Origin recognition complex subunit 2 n=1 Tax=Cetraspora pellucida TaxID=1433469 RepID=A0A9N9IB60_9GLOM|nr:21110_t:CDS:1 [Cetraspora pellucida]
MTSRRVLGELNIQNISEQNLSAEQEQANAQKNKRSIPEQNLPEQEQTNVQKNKRSISIKEPGRKIKKAKKHDINELTELETSSDKKAKKHDTHELTELDNKKVKKHGIHELTELETIPDKKAKVHDVKELTELETISDKHVTETKTFSELYKSQFSQWYLELRSGFNILFYGHGSKKGLLEEFAEAHLRDQPLIVIDGLCSKLDIKETFMQIIDGVDIDVGIKPGTRASVEKLTTLIREYFSNPDRDFQRLNIVIHNIDGQNLCTSQIQNCLSILASCPNICLVASIDHINATLLFDQDRAAKFNWVWHDISAFRIKSGLA